MHSRPKRFMRRWLRPPRAMAGLLILLAAVWWTCAGAAGREPAPSFTLPDIAGAEQSLAEYRGKVVLLNFWASWCPPCRAEMPQLEALYRALKDRGFVVLAVASDAVGNRAVKPAAEQMKLTFPVLLDADLTVTNLYRVGVRPTTYLLDRDSGLVTRLVGPRDWNEDVSMRDFIEELLVAEPGQQAPPAVEAAGQPTGK